MQEKDRDQEPLLVIVGSTGVGKSRLAVDVARVCHGEVVSADSMQVYDGLPIGTNRVTRDEMGDIPHHMLGICGVEHAFSVVEYRDLALQVPWIADIHARGNLPIVVGGTHYYVQALLWPSLMDEVDVEQEESCDGAKSDEVQGTTPLERLLEIDPLMANRLHPHDVRKIKRSLEVFEKTGRKHSELVAQQRQSPRFRCAVIWLDCEGEVLQRRLDDRVDDMLARGLVDEVRATYKQLVKVGKAEDTTIGIRQSIGYKEFLPYVTAVCEQAGDADTSALDAVRWQCIEQFRRATRTYARRQPSWIRNRFVKRGIPVYRFDTTDPTHWNELVMVPTLKIVECLRKGEIPSSVPRLPVPTDPLPSLDTWRKYVCADCGGKVLNGEEEWDAHLRSRRHRRQRGKRAKRA